ncbi:hypothetical protein ACIP6Q_39085 [Streptomyces bobili]|uniref:hypothetical protein n=1 Tax=Streptomyces bobili TaxID=67280 RepID=UPI0037F90241
MAGRRFTAADGWKDGEPAPAAAYRALGTDRETPDGPVLDEHPGGYARLIVAEGQTVTADILTELRAAPAPADSEQPTAASDGEKG